MELDLGIRSVTCIVRFPTTINPIGTRYIMERKATRSKTRPNIASTSELAKVNNEIDHAKRRKYEAPGQFARLLELSVATYQTISRSAPTSNAIHRFSNTANFLMISVENSMIYRGEGPGRLRIQLTCELLTSQNLSPLGLGGCF